MHRDLGQLFPWLGLGFPFVNWFRQPLRLLSLQNSSVPRRDTSIPTAMLPFLCSASDHALGVCWLWGTLLNLAAFPLLIFKKLVLATQSCLALCDPSRFLCSWDSPGKNIGVGFHFLLPGIFFKKERIRYTELESWGFCIFLGTNTGVAPSRNFLPHLCSLSQSISKSPLENLLSEMACQSPGGTGQTLSTQKLQAGFRGPPPQFLLQEVTVTWGP